jgi:hypothetical protein
MIRQTQKGMIKLLMGVPWDMKCSHISDIIYYWNTKH